MLNLRDIVLSRPYLSSFLVLGILLGALVGAMPHEHHDATAALDCTMCQAQTTEQYVAHTDASLSGVALALVKVSDESVYQYSRRIEGPQATRPPPVG